MAMVIRDVCPRCQSPKHKKNGHIHNGKQNHQCKNCGRQFVMAASVQQRIAFGERAGRCAALEPAFSPLLSVSNGDLKPGEEPNFR